jgi:hypothetical protein
LNCGAVGDRRSEGDATRRLSSVLWHLARGQEATAAAETAVATLEPLPAGIELARAYANLAARRMMAARHEEATEAAQHAQSIAATQSAPDVISDALDTEAVSAFHLGRDWAGLMDRALRIALDHNLHAAAGAGLLQLLLAVLPRAAVRRRRLDLRRRHRLLR